MIRFYYYVIYRLRGYYNYTNKSDSKIHSFIVLGGIFLIHLLTIYFYISTLFNLDILNIDYTGKALLNRLLIYPLMVSPIFIIMYLFFGIKREKLSDILTEFTKEDIEKRRRNGFIIVIYFILTLVFFFGSITSPLWLK